MLGSSGQGTNDKVPLGPGGKHCCNHGYYITVLLTDKNCQYYVGHPAVIQLQGLLLLDGNIVAMLPA